MTQCGNTFEKVFEAWKKLESFDRHKLEQELNQFIAVCRGCRKMAFAMQKDYSAMYRMDTVEEMPIIMAFFKEVAEYSAEAYAYLSEGHDMLNLKIYLKMKGVDVGKIPIILNSLLGYSEYLRHSFLRIYDEPDAKKKEIMLRGMLAM